MNSEEFKVWRAKLGYTQAQVAEQFKISRVTVVNWESEATPIPHVVGQLCNVYDMLWKMRDDFGPVTLVFGNGAFFLNPYGPNPMPKPLERERYPNNREAIARACDLINKYSTMWIVADDEEIVWNGPKLRIECEKRIQQSSEVSKNRLTTRMKTKVFRVSCFAGIPLDRTPETPVKKVTVYLPDNVRRESPSPEGKAQTLAHEVLKLEIANDHQFGVCHWVTESTEVDLSDYATPNLESSNCSKVWRN